jgi:hypothetical protein
MAGTRWSYWNGSAEVSIDGYEKLNGAGVTIQEKITPMVVSTTATPSENTIAAEPYSWPLLPGTSLYPDTILYPGGYT